MTRAYLPDGIETLLNTAITQNVEGGKVDFKRELSIKGEAFAEFLMDVCSIANTDDPDHFDNDGYIIIGFDRNGTPHGLEAGFDADKRSAELNETLKKYIAPHIPLQVLGPLTHPNGTYAAIRIPASQSQPHMIIRASGKASPGQWWVRKGDTKSLAGPEDYTRVLSKSVARETAPLQNALTTTRALLGNLEQRFERQQVAALQQAGLPVADAPDLDIAAKIRSQYSTPEIALKQALHRTLLDFQSHFEALFPDSSIERANDEPALYKKMIEDLERITQPLGEGLATAVLYGEGALDEAVGRILVEVMEKTLTFPSYGSLNRTVEHLRAYPLNLLTFSVFTAAVEARRLAWLKPYAEQTGRQFLENGVSTMLEPARRLVLFNDQILRALPGNNRCAPAYQRVIDVTVGSGGWLNNDLSFAMNQNLIAKVELVQSLIYQGTPDVNQRTPHTPIPNTLVYRRRANQIIQQIIESDWPLLESIFGLHLHSSLKLYVNGVTNYFLSTGCWVQVTTDALAGLPQSD